MTIWLPSLQTRRGTRAQALVDALRSDIDAGLLRPGDRLPPQRDLAERLGLSPHTVMRAYAEAIRRGYVRGEVGRGTYVRARDERESEIDEAELSRPEEGPVDFSRNLPFPGEAGQALATTLADLVRDGNLAEYLDHERAEVGLRHQRAAAAWLARLGLSTHAQRIVLTCGAQQGIFSALAALLRPGDVLLTEALAYAPVKAMARHLGVRIVGLAMDEEGIVPQAIDAACRRHRARVLYFTPTLQTPTGATLGRQRRQEIAQIAQVHDLMLVEDDVFGFLPQAPPAPVAVFAPDRTVFVTGMSKTAAPGLRVGFVHAPAQLVGIIRAAVSTSTWMPPPLMGEIATRWITDGTAETQNERQRTHAARRQAMARTELSGRASHANPHGSHLWLVLPPAWQADTFTEAAKDAGVLVTSASTFAMPGGQAADAVRLCLSNEASDERVRHGLKILARLLRC